MYHGTELPGPGESGVVLGFIFVGYLPLASQSPYPIIVYSVANFRAQLSHFWANVILAIPTSGAFQKSELACRTMARPDILAVKDAFSKKFC